MNLTPESIELDRIAGAVEYHDEKLERARRLQNYHPLFTLLSATVAGWVELLCLYPFEVC